MPLIQFLVQKERLQATPTRLLSPLSDQCLMEVLRRVVLSMVTLLALVACSHDPPQRWEKPTRVVNISADVRTALRISGSSSSLSTYGPLAGILNELLPRDTSDLVVILNYVDWSRDICIWTFDTEVMEVSASGLDTVDKARSSKVRDGNPALVLSKGIVRGSQKDKV